MFTVVVPVRSAAAGRRPRYFTTSEFGSWQLPLSEVPLLALSPPAVVRVERSVALIWTSTFGTRYDARPRNEVIHGSVTEHESARLLPCSSGRARHRSQVSRTPRPVEVPACRLIR